jgi:hypothetical protein
MSVSSATPARAELIAGSRATVAGWDINAFKSDSTGKFSHCAMSAPYKSGITMYFSVSGDFTWRVGWSHPAWQFKEGQSVDISVYVDDTGPFNLKATAIGKDMALAELPARSSVFDLMRKGYRMMVYAAGNKYGFNLDGTYAALTEILNCASRHTRVASAPQTPSTPPPTLVPNSASRAATVTAEQRLEATKVVANILAQGDMTGFKLLTSREISELNSEYVSKSDVVWRADGVFGTLRIIPKSAGITAKEIATAVVADDLKNCKGQSVSGSTKDERNPAIVRMFTGCQDGKETYEYRYTVVPVDDDAFYLFATGARSNAGKASEAAKVEVLLREAVYDVMKK